MGRQDSGLFGNPRCGSCRSEARRLTVMRSAGRQCPWTKAPPLSDAGDLDASGSVHKVDLNRIALVQPTLVAVTVIPFGSLVPSELKFMPAFTWCRPSEIRG